MSGLGFHGKTAEQWAEECHQEWTRANQAEAALSAVQGNFAEAVQRNFADLLAENVQLQQALAERTTALEQRTLERDLLKGQLDADDTRIYDLYMQLKQERTEDRAAIRALAAVGDDMITCIPCEKDDPHDDLTSPHLLKIMGAMGQFRIVIERARAQDPA